MLILAFESSAKAASVALCRDGHLVSQYSQCSGLTHSRTLLPMAEDMLKNAELTLRDVDLIAVAHGPGSFTGIRIGVSTVKGLAWAGDTPCVGVSTLEAMAWHGLAAGSYVCPVMDARRSQVYNALFEIRDGRPQRLCPDRPIALAELAEDVKKLDAPVFLVGDGAAITKAFFDAQGIPCRVAPENLLWQDAWGVAMAAMDKEPGNADSLLPVYLRLSQAERERQERLNAEQHANT
ncbi:MAG: tRNA (adenosine(37)-N6)-threonylcarbamoyltransferase complex dimerization subunit type 1 TsaB [Candidatus Limivicinus sp.]|nr:tRNA (adenosine(37)-N6)-threonylcarbamoyltransferase complex dimerization subunit type 1 TsaB [Candidatus Limivicinus sp.]